mmetsp:Transcript_8735/g.14105  ORF Transcript_8735/g.14105 Transcript_8735/m.14105 type:complete len:281 (+) Transcript_8735:289-1131(+)
MQLSLSLSLSFSTPLSTSPPPPQLRRTNQHRIDQPTIPILRPHRTQNEIHVNVVPRTRHPPLTLHQTRREVSLPPVRTEVRLVDRRAAVRQQNRGIVAHGEEIFVLGGREALGFDLFDDLGFRTGVGEEDLHSVVGGGGVVVAECGQDQFHNLPRSQTRIRKILGRLVNSAPLRPFVLGFRTPRQLHERAGALEHPILHLVVNLLVRQRPFRGYVVLSQYGIVVIVIVVGIIGQFGKELFVFFVFGYLIAVQVDIAILHRLEEFGGEIGSFVVGRLIGHA